MENETYDFVCPCCENLLSLDVEGNVSAIEEEELKPNQRRGIGNLVTETNPRDRFYQDNYLRNQAPKSRLQPERGYTQPLGSIEQPEPEPLVPDSSLIEAHNNDLRNRNIN